MSEPLAAIIRFPSVAQFMTTPSMREAAYTPFMLLPPLAAVRAALWLCLSAAYNEPITLANWGEVGGGAVRTCVQFLCAEWFGCAALTWYFEQVSSLVPPLGLPWPRRPLL